MRHICKVLVIKMAASISQFILASPDTLQNYLTHPCKIMHAEPSLLKTSRWEHYVFKDGDIAIVSYHCTFKNGLEGQRIISFHFD